jgi:hypothetical protein
VETVGPQLVVEGFLGDRERSHNGIRVS